MSEDIPRVIRDEVDARDGLFCRMCGIHTESTYWGREIHHILFGGSGPGMGGARVHNPDEMVSLCKPCHGRAHAQKSRWQPLLLKVVQSPGVTAFQLARWQRTQKQRNTRKRDLRRA